MKRKSTFLRLLLLLAVFLPWATQAQNAKVSEYDYEVDTVAYASIASTGTAWTSTDISNGYVDVTMPFAIYMGETQIASGSTLRVNGNGSATFTGLTDSELSPMKYSSGYSGLGATSVYYKADATGVTVEWRKVKIGTNVSLSFQLKIMPNGDIKFCYGPMTVGSSQDVYVGLMSGATDIFRVGGSSWGAITRYTSGATTRTLSSTSHPYYSTTDGQGLVYTFTQPACVKPTSITASSSYWDSILVGWTAVAGVSQYEVYITDESTVPTDADNGIIVTSTTAKVKMTDGNISGIHVGGLHGSTSYHVYVRKYCGTTPSGWAAYSSTCTTSPSCPTLSSSNFSLSAEGVAKCYLASRPNITSIDIYYSTENNAPTANTVPSKTVTRNADTLTIDLTTEAAIAASSATRWYVWFRGNCTADGGTTLAWTSSALNFTTPCGVMNLPYSENFTNYSGFNSIYSPYNGPAVLPLCWDIISNGTNTAATTGSAYFGGVAQSSGTSYGSMEAYNNYLYLYGYYSTSATNSTMRSRGSMRYAIMPAFNTPLSNVMVSFDYKMSTTNANTKLYLGYVTNDDTTTFTVLSTYNATTTKQTVSEFALSSVNANIPTGARLAFKWKAGTTDVYCGIDNIVVVQAPTCFRPSTPVVSNVTANSAVLTWRDNGASQYEVKVGPTGFDPETEGRSVIVSDTTATLGMLAFMTEYEAYVRGICSTTDKSDWSNSCTIATICPNGVNVEVLTGTQSSSNGYVPVDDFYNYTYTQQIVKASEMGGAKTLTKVKFNYYYSTPMSSITDVTIYLGHTSKNSFSSTTDWVSSSALTEVYSGDLNCTQGWNEFTFTTPFEYNGTDNLVIAIDDNSGAYDGSSYKFYTRTGSEYLTLAYRSDGTNPDPANPPTGTRQYYRSEMIFPVPCVVDCAVPTELTVTPDITTATVSWTDANETAAGSYIVKYGPTGFNPETEGTTVTPNPTTTSASLTGLEGYTLYDVYVAAKCSATDTSNYSMVTFRTRSNCNAPENIAAVNVFNSQVTIVWDEEEISEGAYWKIKYGPAGFDPETAGDSIITTTNTNVIEHLDAYTDYDVYARLVCSNILSSVWTDVVSFKTSCPTPTEMDITGESSSTSYFIPTNNYYHYSYSQQIVLAGEMQGAAALKSIKFYYDYSSAITKNSNVTLYLGYTDKSSFTSSTDVVDPTTLTAVYNGTLNCQQGWNEVTFNTPFQYDGSSNLVVAAYEPISGYDGSSYVFGTETTSQAMAISYYSDSYVPDITSLSNLTSFSGSKATHNFRTKMMFTADCDASVTCFAPVNFTSEESVTKDSVILSWNLRNDLRPLVKNFEVKYGNAGFDPENAGFTRMVNNDSVLVLTFNDLSYGSNYDFYVRTVCDADNDDYSAWVKTSFTTQAFCWAPEFTAASATATSFTLSWDETTPAARAANRWEIAYSDNVYFDPDDPSEANYAIATTRSGYVLDSLAHSTVYRIYVRSLCTDNDYSDWSQPILYYTQCATWNMEDMPLTQDFTVYVSSTNLPACWTRINNGTSYATYPNRYGYTPYPLYFYSYGTSNTDDQYAVFPPMNFDVDTLDLNFWAYSGYSSNTVLEVGVMSDITDTTTFVVVDTVDLTSSWQEYNIPLSSYTGSGRYVAFRMKKPGYYIVNAYVDDVVLKLRERVNTLADNGGTLSLCQEYITPTVDDNGNYGNNLNATYTFTPAESGKVLHITGSVDLEYGYDFVKIYDGTTLLGSFTGDDYVDVKTPSYDWTNHRPLTMVFTTDGENSLDYTGFKLFVACECPEPDSNIIQYDIDTNRAYTWVNGRTYNNVSNSVVANDRSWNDVRFYQKNVAQCDSVVHNLNLVIHPSYVLTRNEEMCQRDTFQNFYNQVITTTGNYTGTAATIHGADSTTTLSLQVHNAPDASIRANGVNVTAPIANFCDGQALTLEGRSNNQNATFIWDDTLTANTYTVYPHESNTYKLVVRETAYGCTSLPVTVSVTTTPVAVPVITVTDSVLCYGESTTLTVADNSGLEGVTFRWSTGATGNSITVTPETTTTYTVTALTTTNCATTASQTVTVHALPVVTVTNSASDICLGDNVTITATAVEGYTYAWDLNAGTGITGNAAVTIPATTGNFFTTVTVTDAYGCVNEFTNSAVAVHPSYEMTIDGSDCEQNLPYTFGTQQLSADGLYTETFTIAYGCDSIVHLNFTVLDTAVENSYRELCQGTSFTFGDSIYQQSYVATETTDISVLNTLGHCPVYQVLHLTVNNPAATTFERVVCDSTLWNGTLYTESGNHVQTLATTKGCDSVVTMQLTVNNHSFATREEVACDSLVWNNETYYEPGTYTQNFVRADVNGCDSTETVTLTAVNHASYTVDTNCAVDAFTWIDGNVYTMSETEGNIVFQLPENTAENCPKYAVLHLTVNLPADTLLADTVTVCDEYVIDTVSCEGKPVTHYVRESGDYLFRVADGNNTVIKPVNLTVRQSQHHTNPVTACVPYTWQVETGIDTLTNQPIMYTVGTFWRDTVVSFQVENGGCGDIEVLRFTAVNPEVRYTDVTICRNQSYSFTNEYGQLDDVSNYIDGTGLYKFATYVDPSDLDNNTPQCRYNDTLRVVVNPVYNVSNVVFVHDSELVYDSTNNTSTYYIPDANHVEDTFALSFTGTRLDYVNDPNDYVNGNWTINSETVNGCDSIVNIHMGIFPDVMYYDTVAAACYQFTWDRSGETYTESTKDTVVYKDYIGWTYQDASIRVDMAYILDVTITDTIRTYDTAYACTSYEYEGVTYRDTRTFREFVGTSTEGCDMVNYHTVVVRQRQLTDVYVVTSDPYTWHGTTYTASTNDAWFNTTDINGCDSTVNMHLTMVDSVVICETQLPYTSAYGFVLDSNAVDGIYRVDTADVDTIISYIINRETHNVVEITNACDYYVWRHGNDSTRYDADGAYTYNYTNEKGCASVDTLKLTLKHNTNQAYAAANCNSYTWLNNDSTKTFTVSGTYYNTYVAANGCQSVDTLYLTINKNPDSTFAVSNCYSYEWEGETYTASNKVWKTRTDANGCEATDTLDLTILQASVRTFDSIVNEASIHYNNVLYTIPSGDSYAEYYIVDTLAVPAANTCDSIWHMTLKLYQGNVVNDTFNYCGLFTWERNGHTYSWLSQTDRLNHGGALYYDVTDSDYVMTNPMFNTYNADGSINLSYVLWLTLSETAIAYETVADSIPLSWTSYTVDATHSIDLSMYNNTTVTADTTVTAEVRYGSTYYCDSVVYYTINLKYNYTTDSVAVCGTETEYVWNDETYPLTSHNFTYVFAQTLNEGTLNEVKATRKVYYKPVNEKTVSATACEKYVWNNETYYTSGNYVQHFTGADGCDSAVTTNLVVRYSDSQTTVDSTCAATYTWHGQSYTATGVYYFDLDSTNNCPTTDTLRLTLIANPSAVYTREACDSYTWEKNSVTYTTSGSYTAEYFYGGVLMCTAKDSMILTVNNTVHTYDSAQAYTSYRYNGVLYTYPYDGVIETVDTAVNGCDSINHFHLVIDQYLLEYDNQSDCGMFTWTGHNGHTYVYMSGEERVAANNALYKDLTTGNFVYDETLPRDTVNNTIYVLNLTLYDALVNLDTIERFPLSQGTLSFTNGDSYDFSGVDKDTTVTVIVRYDVSNAVCDSVVHYTVNLVWNYNTLYDTICANLNHAAVTNYVWDGRTYTGVTPGTEKSFTHVYNEGLPTEQVTTMKVYMRPVNEVTIADTACDMYTWNDGIYLETAILRDTFTDAYGCDSMMNINLLVYKNSSNGTVETVCDSYTWINNGDTVDTYTVSGTYYHAYTDAHKCASVDTLYLTVKYNASHDTSVTVCDNFIWLDTFGTTHGTGFPYTTSQTVVGPQYAAANGCPSYDTLFLTVNHSTVKDTAIYANEGYRYTYYNGNQIMYTTDQLITDVFPGLNSVGCDSTRNIELHVGTAAYNVETVTACNSFTWIDGNTYVWIDPATAPAGALYLNQTTGDTVYYNPTYTYTRQGDYDSICLLRLTLTQYVSSYDVVNFPVSLGTLTYGDSLYNFSNLMSHGIAAGEYGATLKTVNSAVSFGSTEYCDSVVYLTINVINNFVHTPDTDICVSNTSYRWHDSTYAINTTNYDTLSIDTIFYVSGDSLSTVVDYQRLVKHPIVYATVRRAACDTYVWMNNGDTIGVYGDTKAATYNATATLATEYGCDSIVTMVLTMNYNTNTQYTEDRWDSIQWTWPNDNARDTFALSGVYTHDYLTAEGCPSTDQLTVHIFDYEPAKVVKTACDSYTWYDGLHQWTFTKDTVVLDSVWRNVTANNGDNFTMYRYVVDTLDLTVNHNSDTLYNVTACDSYTWNGNGWKYDANYAYRYDYWKSAGILPNDDFFEWYDGISSNDFDSMFFNNSNVYKTSGTYLRFYETAQGCRSVDTLNIVVNYNTNTAVTIAPVCDKYIYTRDTFSATYTQTGTYFFEYLTADECPSVDTVTVTINHRDSIAFDTASCNSFTWDGTTYTTSGTYTKYYTKAETGCDSIVTMNLVIGNHPTYAVVDTTNCGPYTWVVNGVTVDTFTTSIETSTEFRNPATGCDSVVYLRLTVYNAPVVDTVATICENALPYTWRGQTLAEAGQANVTFPIEHNCDSTIVLTLNVNSNVNVAITDGICLGLGYKANGFDIPADSIAEAGVYTFVNKDLSATGCDSTTTLTLTVGDIITTTLAPVTACDSYGWDERVLTASGVYFTEPYTNALGCLSVDTLYLTIINNAGTKTTVASCDSYEWNDSTYTVSGEYYSESYFDTNNCAAVDTLVLTINSSVSNVDVITACDSYAWNGNVYTTSGVYEHSYTTSANCNGIDSLILTINHSSSTNYVRSACDSYTWNDSIYTTSGVYTFDYTSTEGCPSTDTLTLTVRNNTNSSVTMTACDSYNWNNTEYTESGIYTYNYTASNGCASVDTLYLTVNTNTNTGYTATACDSYNWNGITYTQSGTYYRHYNTADYCASVDTLYLTVNNGTTSNITETACNNFTWNSQSYSTSGFYTQNFTGANGCDSVVTMMLTINNPVTSTMSVSACGSYVWEGANYTTSGSYGHTYANAASNGCDSIVTLNLTINSAASSSFSATACGSYTWEGATYTTSGAYTHTYNTVNGCDSVVTLNLTISPALTSSFSASACGSYVWEGITYSVSGSYTHTYTAVSGCDSIVTMNLTITPSVSSSFSASACGSYTWEGTTYTTSGNYTHTYTSATGCDSIVTLNLTITGAVTSSFSVQACDSYTWEGTTYTTSGIYTHNYTSATGCDSIVTLALTISNAINTTVAETVCDSYTWNGTEYTTSGIYTHTYTAAGQCDSNVTLVLTVNHSAATTVNISACESYTWIDGQTYTESTNTPSVSLFTTALCDSVVTLNLTINHATSAIDEQVACDGFIWIDGNNYTASTNEPTYTLTGSNGCDSVVTLHLTINNSVEIYDSVEIREDQLPYDYRGNTIAASGDYIFYATTVNGCDSIVYLNVKVTDIIGIDEVNFDDLKVYPNPTRGQVTLTADNVVKVEVLDMVGRLVATFEDTNTFNISDLAEGAYTLRITLTNGTTVRRVIKK